MSGTKKEKGLCSKKEKGLCSRIVYQKFNAQPVIGDDWPCIEFKRLEDISTLSEQFLLAITTCTPTCHNY
jgi:hypothetical protein